jgi:hypothetical protein
MLLCGAPCARLPFVCPYALLRLLFMLICDDVAVIRID